MAKIYQDWLRIKKEKVLPSVIGIGGEEKAFIREAKRHARNTVVEPATKDFNFDSVSLKEHNIEEIIGMANSLPMMASLRYLEVKDASKLEKLSDKELKALIKYLESPCKTTVVLFLFDKINLTKKIFKKFDKLACLIRFNHPKPYEVEEIILKRGADYKLEFTRQSANFLSLLVGSDLMLLENSLEKLSLALGDKIKISAKHIETHLSDLFVQDAFAFVRALILENHTNIFLNLNNLKRAKEAPIKLVGLIAWQYRQVLSASELLEKRMGEQAVKQKLALFGKSADAVISAAKKHKKTYWGQKLAKLCDLDYKLKSSNTDPWLWLEQFVLEA